MNCEFLFLCAPLFMMTAAQTPASCCPPAPSGSGCPKFGVISSFYPLSLLSSSIHPSCSLSTQSRLISKVRWISKPTEFHSVGTCFMYLFWPHHVACRILVPQAGIEPGAPAVKAWSPHHWIAKKFGTCFKSWLVTVKSTLLFGLHSC